MRSIIGHSRVLTATLRPGLDYFTISSTFLSVRVAWLPDMQPAHCLRFWHDPWEETSYQKINTDAEGVLWMGQRAIRQSLSSDSKYAMYVSTPHQGCLEVTHVFETSQ